MFDIDLDLIRKYDRPGPRYTSYPTAPQFTESFTETDLIAEIERSNAVENPAPLSLYYHIPFCDTLCWFCGCNMAVTKDRGRIHRYLDYLKRETELYTKRFSAGRQAVQLHWGGGTPTHLLPEEIAELAAFINGTFEFTPDAERGCEIDPRELTRAHLEALRGGGFNRISMGVQDFNPDVQKAVNRIQPEEMTRTVVEWVRKLGFDSINLDLMYGLPFQTAENFERTVDTLIKMSPDRVALFNYAHVPWMKKHQKLIREEDLPRPEEKLEILKMSVGKLTDAGYIFIGMDHFAKPDDELSVALREKKLYRNFQGYSTHAGTDLYAFGTTGISQLPNTYSQNVKTEKEYFATLDAGRFPVFRGYTLNEDDLLRRRVITDIMCHFELDFAEIEREFGIDFQQYFAHGLDALREFEEDGLVTKTERGITVHEMGRLLIRNIAMNFDGFIERKQDAAKYSRTI